MRNLKKVLSLSLALVMLLGMMVVGAGAAVATDYADYGEVSADKQEAVQVITAISVMDGTEKGLEPGSTLNRQTAATIVARSLLGRSTADALTASTCVFPDVTADWAKAAVQYCYDRGIVGGVGGGLFDPTSPVTGQQFAAMLLRAVDPEGDYGGDGWINKVVVGANKAGLSDKVAITSTAMTREDAAQMAFNAITGYSPSGATAWSVNGQTFDNFFEAYLAAGDHPENIRKTTADDSLAATVFGLTATETTDDFGSAVKNWNYNDEVVATVGLGGTAATYTSKVANVNALGLSRYTGFAANAQIITDGVSASLTSKTQIKDATGNGVKVDVYASGVNITKVVVVKEYVGTVASVANGKATVDGKSFETDQFARGDVVIYTQTKDDNKIQSMKLAEKIESATVTSFNSSETGTLTTNAGEFGYSWLLTADERAAWSLDDECTLYLDSYGNVVRSTTADSTAIGNYAYIISAAVRDSSTGLDGMSMNVRAARENGTVAVYSVALVEGNSGKVGDITVAGAAADKWYAVTGTTASDCILVYTITRDGGGNITGRTESLTNIEDKVFGYTVDGSSMTLKAVTASGSTMTRNDTYVDALGTNYTGSNNTLKVSSNNHSALINNNTAFVIIDGNKATLHTGKINIGSATLTSANTTVVMTAAGNTTATAKVVFTTAGVTVQEDVAGYAYVDFSTAYTAKDSSGKRTTFYKAINEDNETIDLAKGSATVSASGVYGYDDNNVIVTEIKAASPTETIGNQIGNSSDWWFMTDDTKYVYAKDSLSGIDGNDCVIIDSNNDGDADVVFIVSAPAGTAASVSIDKTTLSVVVNKTGTIKVTYAAGDSGLTADSYTWTSDNEAVATVSNGVVTGKSAGSANISVVANLSDGSQTPAEACAVTVTAAPSFGVNDDPTETTINNRTGAITVDYVHGEVADVTEAVENALVADGWTITSWDAGHNKVTAKKGDITSQVFEWTATEYFTVKVDNKTYYVKADGSTKSSATELDLELNASTYPKNATNGTGYTKKIGSGAASYAPYASSTTAVGPKTDINGNTITDNIVIETGYFSVATPSITSFSTSPYDQNNFSVSADKTYAKDNETVTITINLKAGATADANDTFAFAITAADADGIQNPETVTGIGATAVTDFAHGTLTVDAKNVGSITIGVTATVNP